MNRQSIPPIKTALLLPLPTLLLSAQALAQHVPDARLRELVYDPAAVVTVPVKRGVVTLIQLGDDEAITEVAAGLGGDCAKPETSWCIAAQAGSRVLFVKPKSGAVAPNTLAVVTDKRAHSFRLVMLSDGDPRPPVYRLRINRPATTASALKSSAYLPPPPPQVQLVPLPELPAPHDLVTERLKAQPLVRNAQYSLAQGEVSEDIVPTLVFDDGRFTYLRFPGNRELPTVFQVLGDGTESLVNSRMENELLVVDRVSRRLMLRAGTAVVGVWNEAFDPDGQAPEGGTTVPGIQRVLLNPNVAKRGAQAPQRETPHE